MGLEQLYRRRCPHATYATGDDDHDLTDDDETTAAPISGSPSPPPVPRRYISSLRARNRRSGSLDTSNCDPQTRLTRCLRAFYRDLAACDTVTSQWAPSLPPGALCPAYFRPALELDVGRGVEAREPVGLCDLLSPVTTKGGAVLESPRKVLVEGNPGSGKTALALRLLHSWATQNSWWGPSISVALFVPLRELRGRSICQYLCRELLPRSAAADLPALWHRFSALEDRLLFVLDGYDEALGPTSDKTSRLSEDAHDLLCGRLFPECRLVVTSCPEFGDRLAPFVQRKVRLLGREWSQVERFIGVYFGGPKADRLLKVICDNKDVLKPLSQAPLGWLCLCLLYEESFPQDFPKDLLRVYESLTQCLSRRRLVRRSERNSTTPIQPERSLTEFGRLALDCIKTNGRYVYSEAEVKRARRHSGATDIAGLSMLNRSTTFGRRARARTRDHVYTLIHPSFAEYLAARHIMKEATRGGPQALRRELESLPGIGRNRQLSPSTVLILRFLMGMLGARGHLILDLLCPLDLSTTVVLLLLKEAGAHRANVTTVCRLLGGSVKPSTEWPRVHTTPAELEGWTYVLLSGHCSLDRLELVYQLGNLESAYLEMFFKALSFNDSVRLVKISSLLDEWTDVEGLAANVSTALAKSRLSSFELAVTCLQEESPDRNNRFQCVVDEICSRLVTRSSKLDRLSLDLSLSSVQVQQLCRSLESGRGVSSLHLPHLCLDAETAASVAKLILARPLAALNVTGSWSAVTHEDVPSSSGVSSMGSGSKLSPNGPPSPPHVFSSLPRGAIGSHGSGTRPATLPRQPLLEQTTVEGSKRLADSLVWQRHFHYPGCSETGSGVGCLHQHGFHKIFDAVRDNRCVLDHLNVSRCVFAGSEDAACLGESVRKSRTLHSLRMEGFTRFIEVLPVVLALAENVSLQLLDLGSSRITLEDNQTQLVCKSLARNVTLRTLNLDGWTYRLEESGTLKQAMSLVATTRLVELVLDNCRIHLASGDIPGTARSPVSTFRNEALRHIRMAGLQVTINDKLALYGPTLLPFLVGFAALAHLDLSADKSQANTVDDQALVSFFTTLSRHFRSLKVLIANNWALRIETYEKTFRNMRKALENCTFTVLKMHGLVATAHNTAKRTPIEHIFLKALVHGVVALGNLDISGMALTKRQAEHFAGTLRTRPGTARALDVNVDGMASESVRTIVAQVKTNPKLQVTYLGGLACVIRVHPVRDKQQEEYQQQLLLAA